MSEKTGKLIKIVGKLGLWRYNEKKELICVFCKKKIDWNSTLDGHAKNCKWLTRMTKGEL